MSRRRETAGLEKKLHELDPDLTVEISAHDSDKRFQAPTKLKNNFIVKPFEMFVDMYGTPAYNETDPTSFLAWTYILLFGIMFGDLGQGLVIAGLGLFLDRVKKMNFGKILERIGLSAAVFGLVYGSVFGLNTCLIPSTSMYWDCPANRWRSWTAKPSTPCCWQPLPWVWG